MIRLKQFIPNYVKRDIATALIDPILSYGDEISYGWGAHGTQSQENRILVADNDKMLHIYGLKCYDHVSEYRERLNRLNSESNAKLDAAVLIHKQLSKQSPVYLNHMFVCNGSSYRFPDNIRVSFTPRTAFDIHAFSFAAINFGNSVPVEIRNIN